MTTTATPLNELEQLGSALLEDFYRAYRNQTYGLYEMLCFAYQKGRADEKRERERTMCIEGNASNYLQENGDIHND